MVEAKKVKVGIQITDEEGAGSRESGCGRKWSWVEGFGGKRMSVALDGTAGARPTDAELNELSRAGEVQFAMLLADPEDTPDHPVFRQLVA